MKMPRLIATPLQSVAAFLIRLQIRYRSICISPRRCLHLPGSCCSMRVTPFVPSKMWQTVHPFNASQLLITNGGTGLGGVPSNKWQPYLRQLPLSVFQSSSGIQAAMYNPRTYERIDYSTRHSPRYRSLSIYSCVRPTTT